MDYSDDIERTWKYRLFSDFNKIASNVEKQTDKTNQSVI